MVLCQYTPLLMYTDMLDHGQCTLSALNSSGQMCHKVLIGPITFFGTQSFFRISILKSCCLLDINFVVMDCGSIFYLSSLWLAPFLFGLRQANLVLIAYVSSEGSGEPAHPRSLARTSALAHTSSELRGTFRQKARSLAPLNGWACAVKICHDGMLEDTNLLDAAHSVLTIRAIWQCIAVMS